MDRWITHGIFWWSMFWVFVFAAGTIAYLVHRHFSGWSNRDYNGIWADYYLVTGIYLSLCIGALTTVWFTIGCWSDIWVFFRRLREEKIDIHDDGSVEHEEAIGAFEVMPIPGEPGVAVTAADETIL
jgi:SSS family solute:Na+ symporter